MRDGGCRHRARRRAVGGIIGFFVIPVVGIIVGFLLGVFLAEWIRVRSLREAWPTTVTAMKAAAYHSSSIWRASSSSVPPGSVS